MNLSHAVFLVNKEARALKAVYEPHLLNGNDEYVTVKGQKVKDATFKTLDKSIKVGDLCVVPSGTRHGFTVVKITEADVSIDFENKDPVEWIVSKVDLRAYQQILKDEEELTEKIKVAEMQVRRDQLLNALDLSGKVTSLPLAGDRTRSA